MKETTNNNDLAVLRQDKLGRVRTPAARREQLLDEFERSGLAGTEFAALAGIKYQTLATWAQKRRRQRQAELAGPVPANVGKARWLEAVIEQTQPSAAVPQAVLVLHLPGGARVELGDTKQVALAAVLVRALQRPC
jgi:hypothetical protein